MKRKCDVCGKEINSSDGYVLCSDLEPVSYFFCHECAAEGLEPYNACVSVACVCNGYENLNNWAQEKIAYSLQRMNKTIEDLNRDVDKWLKAEDEYYESLCGTSPSDYDWCYSSMDQANEEIIHEYDFKEEI